jgi:uncharacterized protein YneF (UPF0154 family)
MSIIMIVGGLIFYNTRKQLKPVMIDNPPFVSILIPCYCEGKNKKDANVF